jgi:hypothetical protein
LDIIATLIATPDNFNTGDFNISFTSLSIGDLSDYTFQLKISQPLGNDAFLLFYLPK